MFAENRELLPKDLFVSCVQDCLNGANTYFLMYKDSQIFVFFGLEKQVIYLVPRVEQG
jgi:hypothetical protein